MKREDPEIAAIARGVMEQIRACTPGARLAEVPTLFAFKPIYDAIAAARVSTRRQRVGPDLDHLAEVVPQLFGEAIQRWPWLTCAPHEWDNRTTTENAVWLIRQLGVQLTPDGRKIAERCSCGSLAEHAFEGVANCRACFVRNMRTLAPAEEQEHRESRRAEGDAQRQSPASDRACLDNRGAGSNPADSLAPSPVDVPDTQEQE